MRAGAGMDRRSTDNGNYLFSELGKAHAGLVWGDVALCFGDSGGPAFYVNGDQRFQISVNSRGNIQDTSFLSKTLANDVFSQSLAKWAAGKNVKVCGLHENCNGPVEPEPQPEPEPDPKDDASPFGLKGWLIIVAIAMAILGYVLVRRKLKKNA